MEPTLGYHRTAEVTLVRRKHCVGFRVGFTVKELIDLLQEVPPDATVDEVIDGNEEEDGCRASGIATIEFHEEFVASRD